MSKTPGVAFNLDTKNLITTTAVVTATAIVTIGTFRVAAELVTPPLRKLRNKLEDKSENTNK